MPIITISMTPQDTDKKREIAKTFTSELNRITGVSADKITVLFQDLPADSIATGGELLSDRFAAQSR